MNFQFRQVDVFASERFKGNPLAVVIIDSSGEMPSPDQMQQFANWTNLSETTFLLPPTNPAADYLVRIFTPSAELPFAGHPTLGTCHVWLDSVAGADGPSTAGRSSVVQECEAGLIDIRVDPGQSRTQRRLSFKAPPMTRSGPVDADGLAAISSQLGLADGVVVDAAWIDNGPGWVGILLESPSAVLSVEPGLITEHIGIVAIPTPDDPGPVEGAGLVLRAFFPKDGATVEDPVTGSLNASAAQWLLASGRLKAPYVASQGTVLGRDGRVSVSQDDAGDVWIGGQVADCVSGTVQI